MYEEIKEQNWEKFILEQVPRIFAGRRDQSCTSMLDPCEDSFLANDRWQIRNNTGYLLPDNLYNAASGVFLHHKTLQKKTTAEWSKIQGTFWHSHIRIEDEDHIPACLPFGQFCDARHSLSPALDGEHNYVSSGLPSCVLALLDLYHTVQAQYSPKSTCNGACTPSLPIAAQLHHANLHRLRLWPQVSLWNGLGFC